MTKIVLHRSDPKDSKFADIIDRSLVEAWIYVVHHFASKPPPPTYVSRLTFFFFSISADFSARAFSCDLRFFRRVSGTRIWSLVGTELFVEIQIST